MQTFLQRSILEKRLETLLKHYPAVALLGARQVGKSTLAKGLLSRFDESIYLDLELPRELDKLSDAEAFFDLHEHRLFCLDEVRYKPDVFQILRGVIDRIGQAIPWLLECNRRY